MNATTETLIKTIFEERPSFHFGETEVSRNFTAAESLLSADTTKSLVSGKEGCYGIQQNVARFIGDHVDSATHSLEIGAGISTLVFAAQASQHVSVTPNGREADAIRQYAHNKGIGMDSVNFVIQSSESYLPSASIHNLDFVFVDGKHAFPWPVIDWFYTVERLKQGGIILLDDAHMISGKILVDFMTADPRWQRVADLNGKTFAFKKLTPLVHDVAWHMQPYVVKALNQSESRGLLRRALRKAKTFLR